MAKNKHLTNDERNIIADCLKDNASFKAIGKEIGKDCTTVAKEVKNHITISQTGCMGKPYNNCRHRFLCAEARLCDTCTYHRMISRCRFCNQCNSNCTRFEADSCPKLATSPYVCNGCPDKHYRCTLEKHLYIPKNAQAQYDKTLCESRAGISLSKDEVKQLDELFSPLIGKKQSIHHICVNHRDSVMVSESTIYRLVDYNLFTARNIDLPRKVRYAPRKKKKDFKVDKTCRIGRTYDDYINFRTTHKDLPVTQIDSVEGKKGGKVLLTIHFVKAECMLAFLRDANDSQSVINRFDRLYLELGPDLFCSIMPILLGDNGSEFSNPRALEFDGQGNRRTHVFYCDPYAPEQKGSCERNHEFIRMFIPKGSSLDHYTQGDIDRMIDHINSYSRPSLGNKCPYEMMTFLYGEKILSRLGCHRIAPDDVTLNQSIFQRAGDSNA